MQVYTIMIQGLVVGQVKAENRLKAGEKAMEYFPGCDGMTENHGMYRYDNNMAWITEDKAIYISHQS